MIDTIEIESIRMDGGTQVRTVIDGEVVREYADDMEGGDRFPAVEVVWDGTDYWLVDGFHRVHAAMLVGRETVEAVIAKGTREKAVETALGANAQHGMRRNKGDKTRAVELAMRLRPDAPNREIARLCCVDEKLVRYVKDRAKDDDDGGGSPKPTGKEQGKSDARQPVVGGSEGGGSKGTAPPPNTPVDERGVPVPDALAKVFHGRKVYDDLIKRLHAIDNEAKQLAGSPSGEFLGLNAFMEHTRAARGVLKQCRPYAVNLQGGWSTRNDWVNLSEDQRMQEFGVRGKDD